MPRPSRTLRIAVGTVLLGIGACNKDKTPTQVPDSGETETTNVGPTDEPSDTADTSPTDAPPTDTSPTDAPPTDTSDDPPDIEPTTNTGRMNPPR